MKKAEEQKQKQTIERQRKEEERKRWVESLKRNVWKANLEMKDQFLSWKKKFVWTLILNFITGTMQIRLV